MKAEFQIDENFEEKKEYDPWKPVFVVDPSLADAFLENSELELEQETQ